MKGTLSSTQTKHNSLLTHRSHAILACNIVIQLNSLYDDDDNNNNSHGGNNNDHNNNYDNSYVDWRSNPIMQ